MIVAQFTKKQTLPCGLLAWFLPRFAWHVPTLTVALPCKEFIIALHADRYLVWFENRICLNLQELPTVAGSR